MDTEDAAVDPQPEGEQDNQWLQNATPEEVEAWVMECYHTIDGLRTLTSSVLSVNDSTATKILNAINTVSDVEKQNELSATVMAHIERIRRDEGKAVSPKKINPNANWSREYTMKGAAKALGLSENTLRGIVKRYPESYHGGGWRHYFDLHNPEFCKLKRP